MLYEVVYAFVLETYSIEHTRRSFGHARVVVALTPFESSALDHETAEASEVEKITVFEAVAECTRGGKYGVTESNVAYFSAEVYHGSSSMLNTGPSVHTQRLPVVVFSTQQRQAPRPHAILFSSEN